MFVFAETCQSLFLLKGVSRTKGQKRASERRKDEAKESKKSSNKELITFLSVLVFFSFNAKQKREMKKTWKKGANMN